METTIEGSHPGCTIAVELIFDGSIDLMQYVSNIRVGKDQIQPLIDFLALALKENEQ